MKAEALLSDPGFQLNLLLWMTRAQPPEAYLVRPIFREQGFSLLYIENPLPLPEETAQKAASSGMAVSVNPEPDVLLRRERDNTALCIEAKGRAFSSNSSTARQARGHLLACGPAFAETLKPLTSSLLCYLVPNAETDYMGQCLSELSRELSNAGFKPGDHCVHGLHMDGSAVVYSWDSEFRVYAGYDSDSAIVMRNLQDGTDPSPLFLVFSDEDYPDPERQELNRKAFQNQVYAALLCQIQQTAAGEIYSRTIRDLLLNTTDGIFQYIGRDRQLRMCRLVRENIFKRILSYWKERIPDLVSLDSDSLIVRFADSARREQFLDWLEDYKRTAFACDKPPDEEPLPLLEMMNRNDTTDT